MLAPQAQAGSEETNKNEISKLSRGETQTIHRDKTNVREKKTHRETEKEQIMRIQTIYKQMCCWKLNWNFV